MKQSAIVKPYQEKIYQQANIYCCYNANAIDDFSPEMLNSDFWHKNNAITGSAQGRGTTWFVQYDSPEVNTMEKQQWVLRHYFRGGLIGKIINDKYFFTGQNSTRAAQEYHLLNTLQGLALPAPKPVAFRVIKQGLFYQADLLSSRIEHAQDLVAVLSKAPLVEHIWREVGKVIRRFHDAGIYHHDLNSHNILLDEENNVWLIDFDRGEQRAVAQSWQQANMARLLRSFEKEKAKLPNFNWQKSDWQLLLAGYLQSNE
ncbi:3-deoxy-D-manno-octulosonic acid kinase [Colwellia sp. BRX8-9]|uniref:3-deoxy-D-manno-octulosonic acid kinase n=1 Tax=Colwellia sp. BRX8-9 TaxID=2759831 RepID=UPI001C70DEA8|nr:3-deoxy-D-manno-octulosonic acid kinase [Colwellia sp. BRX8-9]